MTCNQSCVRPSSGSGDANDKSRRERWAHASTLRRTTVNPRHIGIRGGARARRRHSARGGCQFAIFLSGGVIHAWTLGLNTELFWGPWAPVFFCSPCAVLLASGAAAENSAP